MSGRNRGKIDRIKALVVAGLNVLADKPWVLRSADLPTLETVLADADRKGLVAYDIMTERFEVTSILQRLLVNDRAVFGEPATGTDAEPAVYMESVHHLMKVVAGAPNIRPAWFFETAEQGEGLNDIGTHLADLVQWTLFPDQGIDAHRDIQVVSAQRWATPITAEQFSQVTGEKSFPSALEGDVKDGVFQYFCNTLVNYRLRGRLVRLNVIWDWEAPAGSGDRHFAVYRGAASRVEVRQTQADGYRPELYVVPQQAGQQARILAAVQQQLNAVQNRFPGVSAEPKGEEIHVVIPDRFRVGHEAHFAQVTRHFLGYLEDRKTLPAWERPNMLAKYVVTTTGTELSRQSPPQPAPRIAP
jgi:predicted dehydrogenase